MTLAKFVEIHVKDPSFTDCLIILFTCSKKFKFPANVKPRCFRNKLLLNGILLNKRVE